MTGKRKIPERFLRIKEALLSSPVHLCPERAILITDFFKKHDRNKEPMAVRKARALSYLLQNKSVQVWPDELIVGNVGTRRNSAIIHPELAGVFMCEDLLWIEKRKITPHPISWSDRWKLLTRVIPYWLSRNMVFRAFRGRLPHLLRYIPEQLNATYYLINEAGGIGHFLPNYERVLQTGLKGYLSSVNGSGSSLIRAARIACQGVADLARRISRDAESMAAVEKDRAREAELREIARICSKVPYEPAETFREALQSLWLTHLAVCLEGINSAVSFGRLDQYLYPYYAQDIKDGRLTPEKAFEFLLCFSAKTTEHVFLVSERTSRYHGGYLVVQAATVGGMDEHGNDAVNDLTYLFLDVMEHAGLRDPNYMARMHADAPDEYVRRVLDVARKGHAVPGLFNDEPTIDSFKRNGFPAKEARDYAIVGCAVCMSPGFTHRPATWVLDNEPRLSPVAGGRKSLLPRPWAAPTEWTVWGRPPF